MVIFSITAVLPRFDIHSFAHSFIQHLIYIYCVRGLGLYPGLMTRIVTQSCNLEVSGFCGGGIGPEQASDIRSRRLPGGGDAGTASGRMTSQVTGKRDGKADEQRSVHTQPEDRKGLVQAHCLDPGPWLRGSPVCRRTAVTSPPCLLPSQPCPHHQFSHKTFWEPLVPLQPPESPRDPTPSMHRSPAPLPSSRQTLAVTWPGLVGREGTRQ